jgi:hypothetical protein
VVVANVKMISEDFLIGRNKDRWSSCRKSDLKSAECEVNGWNFIEARRIPLDLVCEDVLLCGLEWWLHLLETVESCVVLMP